MKLGRSSLGAGTLIEILEGHAGRTPDKVAFTFEGMPCTFRELWDSLNRAASCFHREGVGHGDRVVMALPNSSEFLFAFHGAQRVGGTAVPLFPGLGPERVLSIAGLCGARVIVLPSTIRRGLLTEIREAATGKSVITLEEDSKRPVSVSWPVVEPDDIAFIQYTSGSTGNPKGVQLSHRNLLTNIRQMIDGWRITREDCFVSWLPMYHDMGLIIKTLIPFYQTARLHLLHTSLKDIRRWLQTLHDTRATFTAAPDFAYRLCLRYVDDPGRYDLSSLRVALNAAEPVRAQTIIDFENAFGLHSVMSPGYGLAEAAVGVSAWRERSRPLVDDRGFVSVGQPFPGVELRIEEEGKPLGAGEVGEILVRSPANSVGYLNNPEANAAVFRDDGFLHTGDMGYVDEAGRLFVVGRMKDIIIQAGRNLAPQEIEEIVDRQPEVRISAAVGIDRGGIEGEQVYVFGEVREGDRRTRNALSKIAVGVVAALHKTLGVRPARVYLLQPRTIPMTHNGKLQHQLLKTKYLDGSLGREGSILFPDY